LGRVARTLLRLARALPRTFIGLSLAFDKRLPPLGRHRTGVRVDPLAQPPPGSAAPPGSLRPRPATRIPGRDIGALQDPGQRVGRRLLERLKHLAGRGVNRLEAHSMTSGRSRTRSTVQRKPNGSAPVARNWCATPGDTYTQSNGAIS